MTIKRLTQDHIESMVSPDHRKEERQWMIAEQLDAPEWQHLGSVALCAASKILRPKPSLTSSTKKNPDTHQRRQGVSERTPYDVSSDVTSGEIRTASESSSSPKTPQQGYSYCGVKIFRSTSPPSSIQTKLSKIFYLIY